MDRTSLQGVKAADVMTRDVVTVAETATVTELVALLRDHEISGAPVVGEDGKLSGVVSLTDVGLVASESGAIAPERANPDFYVHGWEEQLNPDELRQLRVEEEGLLVRDIMNPAVYSVSQDTAVPVVAATMVKGHLHRVLVTDGEDLVGIVSSLDVLKLVAEAR